MFDWNDIVTFTRKSNVVVQAWTVGTPTIGTIGEAAYLEVKAAGVTPGNLFISGIDADDQATSETISFTVSATSLSMNQYKSISTLIPSWSTYTVDISAVDIQGAPILTQQDFGPYLCSINADPSMTPAGTIAIPGPMKGNIWRITIMAFEPQNGDAALTGKGYNGIVSNVCAISIPNFPTGWVFFLEENPG